MKGKANRQKTPQEIALKDERGTPRWLYEDLNKVFKFDRDVCASHSNHKHDNYFTKDQNALIHDWPGVNYMNPPYSNMLPWIEKAAEEAKKGNVTVALLKSDHSTKWFRILECRAEIHLIGNRIKYEGATNCADFPSLIAIFSKHSEPGIQKFTLLAKESYNWIQHLKFQRG